MDLGAYGLIPLGRVHESTADISVSLAKGLEIFEKSVAGYAHKGQVVLVELLQPHISVLSGYKEQRRTETPRPKCKTRH